MGQEGLCEEDEDVEDASGGDEEGDANTAG